jgi:hypothetical protein
LFIYNKTTVKKHTPIQRKKIVDFFSLRYELRAMHFGLCVGFLRIARSAKHLEPETDGAANPHLESLAAFYLVEKGIGRNAIGFDRPTGVVSV